MATFQKRLYSTPFTSKNQRAAHRCFSGGRPHARRLPYQILEYRAFMDDSDIYRM